MEALQRRQRDVKERDAMMRRQLDERANLRQHFHLAAEDTVRLAIRLTHARHQKKPKHTFEESFELAMRLLASP